MFTNEDGVVRNNDLSAYKKILAERENKTLINSLQGQINEIKKELGDLRNLFHSTCRECIIRNIDV